MAKITLENLKYSYLQQPGAQQDYALNDINVACEDGGAYALLGPSGCGKTTLLNIISGLLVPSIGKVWFDDRDMTTADTVDRQIAQVFQFPVIYDTMTIYDNLAFPLRNRNVAEDRVRIRVREVAAMLDLEGVLQRRASGLSADGKQKISLGRGLVREDVNVMMFDEPLTVIDPHMKLALRAKLKELHQKLGTTMIYVTHDQTEALTFAEKVVVLHDGEVVQVGTPVELYESPMHTFVGYFIGSPGMNVLPCRIDSDAAVFADRPIACSNPVCAGPDGFAAGTQTEIGIRPEFVRFSKQGIPVQIERVDDLGRHQLVHARHDRHTIKLVCPEYQPIPDSGAKIDFDASRTFFYVDGRLAGSGSG